MYFLKKKKPPAPPSKKGHILGKNLHVVGKFRSIEAFCITMENAEVSDTFC